MSKNNIILSFILLFSAVLSADKPENFRFTRKIISENVSGFAEIEPDSSVFRNSLKDFSDVRIFNTAGEEVPFYIKSGDTSELAENEIFKTWKIEEKYFPKTDSSVVSYQVIEEKNLLVNKLAFDFGDEEFSRQVEVYARNENSDWVFIKKDTLYKIRNLIKDTVNLDAEMKYRFYRIVFTGKPSDFKNSDVEASYDSSILVKSDFIKTCSAEYEFVTEDGMSELRIKNSDRLHIRKIRISSEGFYSRSFDLFGEKESFIQSGLLYKAAFNDTDMERTEIVLDSPLNTDAVVSIDNKNDMPIKINSVELTYLSYRFVFKPEEGKEYLLCYGKEDAAAPQYDIEKFRDEIDKEKRFLVSLDKPVENEIKSSAAPVWHKYLFNAVLVIVSIALIIAISMKLRPSKS